MITLRVTTHGRNGLTGEVSKNVYHYTSFGAEPLTNQIMSEFSVLFEEVVQAKVYNIVHTNYSLERFTFEELEGVGYLERGPVGISSGIRAGETALAYQVWPYKLLRLTRVTKSGAKRYGPIAKADFDGNGAPANPQIDDFTSGLGAILSAALVTTTEVLSFWPIIYGQIKNGEPFITINPVSDAALGDVSTQNTRKRNRGS